MLQGSRLFKLVAVVVIAIGFVIGLALVAQPIVQARSFRGNAVVQAPAASIVVNSLADTSGLCSTTGTGTCTLRDAIAYANNTAGADTINFSVSGIITLTSGLVITDDVTIDGSGQSISLNGNNAVQVLGISSGVNATLNALNIVNGYTFGSLLGGAGIYNAGTLTVTNSTLSGNSANYGSGGGITNDHGTLTVINSTFSGNSSTPSGGSGGGISNYYGTMTVINSTFSGNVVPTIGVSGYGGGILNDGTLAVINSTFSGNQAQVGGGIANYGTLTVTNSTFDGNYSNYGGGIYNAGTTTLRNTILANIAPENCSLSVGSFTADAYNLAIDATCGSATQTTTAQINLGPLANNGGNTPTHALLSGSAAIDAGNDAVCPATDQRGITRPQGAHCDVGAYEFNGHFVFLPLVLR